MDIVTLICHQVAFPALLYLIHRTYTEREIASTMILIIIKITILSGNSSVNIRCKIYFTTSLFGDFLLISDTRGTTLLALAVKFLVDLCRRITELPMIFIRKHVTGKSVNVNNDVFQLQSRTVRQLLRYICKHTKSLYIDILTPSFVFEESILAYLKSNKNSQQM